MNNYGAQRFYSFVILRIFRIVDSQFLLIISSWDLVPDVLDERIMSIGIIYNKHNTSAILVEKFLTRVENFDSVQAR